MYMSTISKPIILDETGKEIARSLEKIALCEEAELLDETAPGVKFIDYDGRVVCRVSKKKALDMTKLPDNPDHTGLISQGWNWTLQDIKEYLTKYPEAIITVGQMYITDDGKTRLYIDVRGRRTVPLVFQQSISEAVTINWGDGSAEETIQGTGAVTASHTYAAEGEYLITLEVTDNECALLLGDDQNLCSVLNNDSTSVNINRYLLLHVELGKNITSITKYAFYFNTRLETITIPTGITQFGERAFNANYFLKSITMPPTVTSIGSSCFSTCTMIKAAAISNSVSSIGENGFRNCYYLPHIIIPEAVTTIETSLFYGDYALYSVTIPNTITTIKEASFYQCYNIQSLNIRDDIVYQGAHHFQHCFKNTSVVVSKTNTIVSNSMFASNISNKEINIPNNVVTIDNSAFSSNLSVSSVTIPEGVKNINTQSFSGCYSLTHVVVPSTAISIGAKAFNNCNLLLSFKIYATTPPTLGNIDAFTGTSTDLIIYVPYGCGDAYKAATNWSSFASQIVEMEEGE